MNYLHMLVSVIKLVAYQEGSAFLVPFNSVIIYKNGSLFLRPFLSFIIISKVIVIRSMIKDFRSIVYMTYIIQSMYFSIILSSMVQGVEVAISKLHNLELRFLDYNCH